MSDELLKKISEEVSEIREDQLELLKQSAVHNHILKEHESRSLALQEQIKLNKVELDARLAPIQKHVDFINSIGKLGSIIAASVGVIYYLVQIFSYLFK